jgi:hypothetical protein
MRCARFVTRLFTLLGCFCKRERERREREKKEREERERGAGETEEGKRADLCLSDVMAATKDTTLSVCVRLSNTFPQAIGKKRPFSLSSLPSFSLHPQVLVLTLI